MHPRETRRWKILDRLSRGIKKWEGLNCLSRLPVKEHRKKCIKGPTWRDTLWVFDRLKKQIHRLPRKQNTHQSG